MSELSGITIKAYRERLQLSQADLADRLGLSQSLISTVESGRNPVSSKLLRAIRAKAEEGLLAPSFDEFLQHGGLGSELLERQFGIVHPIVLEPWQGRVNLLQPADLALSERISIPGLPTGGRAFRFAPPPRLVAPDSLAIFSPCPLLNVISEQILLVQFRKGHEMKGFHGGVAYLGRSIVTRRGRRPQLQFEPTAENMPVIELRESTIEASQVCIFRGRYYPQ